MASVENRSTTQGIFGLNALNPHTERDSLLTELMTVCELIEEHRDILSPIEYSGLLCIAQRLRAELSIHIHQSPEPDDWLAIVSDVLGLSSLNPAAGSTPDQTEAI